MASAFEGKEDRYGGVTLNLDPGKYAGVEASEFAVKLSAALEAWRSEGKRAVWMRVAGKVAHLVDPAVMCGFDFHHASPGYVMLTKWLADGPSSLPLYPHHQVGVAGLVLDSTGKRMLCIQEKSGPTANMGDFWKLPGGLVDPKEDLCDAAVREVREETGLDTVFECIASIREMQGGPFGCADLYVVCVLRLADKYGGDGPSPVPVPQEKEIAAAAWRDAEDILASKYYARGLYGALIRTGYHAARRRRAGETELGVQRVQLKGLGGKPESMYYVGADPRPPPKAAPTAKL